MSYSEENLAELRVLVLYGSSTSLEGIKIHKNADPSVIAAAEREMAALNAEIVPTTLRY